jgi:hypothetical protein
MVMENKKAARLLGAAAWLDGNYLSSTRRPKQAFTAATRSDSALVLGIHPADLAQ